MKALRLALALCLALTPALAQNFTMPPPAGVSVLGVVVVSSCGAQSLGTTQGYVTMDTTGKLCTSGSGGGGGGVVSGVAGNNVDAVAPTSTGNVPVAAYNFFVDPVTGNWNRAQALVPGSVSSLGSQVLSVGFPVGAPVTMQNAAVANGIGTFLPIGALNTALLNVNCSGCSGGTTINFEGADSTGSFFAVQASPIAGGSSVTTTTVSGQYVINTENLVNLRARISAYSAGTITVTGQATTAPAGGGGGGGSGGGGGFGVGTSWSYNGASATLTVNGVSSSVALPAGNAAVIFNGGNSTISCSLGVGSATATANQIQVPPNSGVETGVGNNTFAACINQSGNTTNPAVVLGGTDNLINATVALGQQVASGSVPTVLASDQMGPHASTQSMPTAPSSQYPTNAVTTTPTAVTASTTGTTAATAASLGAVANVTNFVCGFTITSDATALTTGTAVLSGTISGSLSYLQTVTAVANGTSILRQTFNPCIPASAANTAITITSAAAGTGGNTIVNIEGYRL